ncbi:unnamed protein product [Knipowitschia caucasica]|uniref:Uncharacterized protein n=1 Tax=Knipowitschia caucasica TaxID=637954 RepID=A0AAV2LIL1_KNICA
MFVRRRGAVRRGTRKVHGVTLECLLFASSHSPVSECSSLVSGLWTWIGAELFVAPPPRQRCADEAECPEPLRSGQTEPEPLLCAEQDVISPSKQTTSSVLQVADSSPFVVL